MSKQPEALFLSGIVGTLCFPNTSTPARAAHLAAAELRRMHNELRRLTAEQAVMRQWIAEVLPVLGSIDSEGECHALDFIVSHQLLRALCESGRRLVDGGPDDLLAGVE